MRDLWHLARAKAGWPPRWPTVDVGSLQRNWDYLPSAPSLTTTLLRRRADRARRGAFPAWRSLKPVTPRTRWSCAFLYLPDGRMTPAHRYMLDRLRTRDAGLLVVCAAPDPASVPAQVEERADALIWKGMGGFDFSAYAVALNAIAEASPGADLLVVNDSVLGPLTELDPILTAMPWDLAGFTASGQVENHLQSYAFQLRSVDPATCVDLVSVMSTYWALERYRDVIYAQESRLANVASRTMRVGALWYGPAGMGDPSVHAALSLSQHGFPFLKRKLFHRDAGIHARAALLAVLEEHGHPCP